MFGTSEESFKSRNKRRRDNSAILSTIIKESATIIGSEIIKATDQLSRVLEDVDGIEKRSMINGILTNIFGLSLLE